MNPSVTSKFALLLIATGLLCLVPAIPAAPMLVPGFVRFEVYTNLPGASIGDLVFAPEYPDSPGRTFYTTALDTRTVYPTDSHENYGGRLTGFLVPTATADYIFFLRGQDACQLFLSPDDDPANLELIAEDEVGGGGFEEPGVPKTSAPRSLVAGQRYAIQVLYKAGVGPDLCQVAWRTTESTTPAAELTPIPGTFLAALIEPRGNVTITRQPTGATLGANQSLTLDVDFTTTHGPIFVQWQKDGANVPGRVGGTVSLGPLTESDSGSYRAVVSIPGAVAISSAVNVTVTPDVTPPTIRRIVVADSLESITVEYSEAVTDTALDVFNYALDGGQQITGDGVRVNPSTVRFGTTRLTIGATYTLTVTDIEDLAGLTSAPGTSRTFTLTRERGGLKFEAWLNLGGNAVSALLSHPAYPDNPDLVAYVTQASSRQVFADAASVDNYGGRLSGWIVPPESGDYEFFIRSDDNSELYLSPDDNPANAVLIASES
ncbi:MAG TPA: PA14 domain-containing protein, partial [Methylomirabilota bacterium]|nr:PA14 domain-containing protein [Methylomirabilota bacterium]